MSELALTLLRLGFLVLLWVGVLTTLSVLRRDLRAPREARPAALASGGAIPVTPQPARRARSGRASRIVVTEGALAGTVVPLGGATVTIGRAQDCTLVLDDDYASNKHCQIYSSSGEWVVEDLNSTNGTWLEKTRITRPTVLHMGVPLRIGRTVMQLRK
ncbi:MAG: FHA domain-containing protein [Candidatus Nanopelagicales bacterium]|nr:FHA domain-containing protein [Candidatus Nanopelagicales bacterium]